MAHKNKVLRSINAPGDGRCVDVFVTPDGQYGFGEYRRDAEDGRGWFPLQFSPCLYADFDTALAAARAELSWLNAVLDQRPA